MMSPIEAELVLAELERRKTKDKLLFDNLWSLYKPTGYEWDRCRVGEVQKRLAKEMGINSRNSKFCVAVTDAILSKGLHRVFVKGKAYYRGLKKL